MENKNYSRNKKKKCTDLANKSKQIKGEGEK